jgi:hypothetical protein
MFNDPTIVLGGCVIYDDSPAFACGACDHAWGEERSR